jgi:hypothetical protein
MTEKPNDPQYDRLEHAPPRVLSVVLPPPPVGAASTPHISMCTQCIANWLAYRKVSCLVSIFHFHLIFHFLSLGEGGVILG